MQKVTALEGLGFSLYVFFFSVKTDIVQKYGQSRIFETSG